MYAADDLDVDLPSTVYALDSTTIDLCLSVFPWAHFRSTKAAVKMHTLLDLRGNIPSFIHVSDGKLHDVHALDMLLPEPGAIYVMDRGYVDFARLHVLHEAGAFFVTRAKSNMDAHRVYSAPADRSAGVISDQTIAMDGYFTQRHYPAHLRRIRFKDPETGKTLIFLTNQVTLPALTICALYKSRWQVELFFKWIKQHLRIKQFYGISENAVKTQIWIAVSVYVLVAIVRKRLRLEVSLYTLLQVFSVTVFEKMPIQSALFGDTRTNSTMLKTATSWNYSLFDRTAVCLHYQLLPEKRLAALMADLFGVHLVTATIARISQDCAAALPGFCRCRAKPRRGRTDQAHGRNRFPHWWQDAVAAYRLDHAAHLLPGLGQARQPAGSCHGHCRA